MQTCHLLLTVSGIYTVRRCVVAAVCRIETKPHTHLLRKRAGDTVHQEYYVRFRTRCLPMCVYRTSALARAPRTGCQREPLSHCFTGKFLLLHSFSVLLIFYLTRCRFVAPSGVCSVDCFSIFAVFLFVFYQLQALQTYMRVVVLFRWLLLLRTVLPALEGTGG